MRVLVNYGEIVALTHNYLPIDGIAKLCENNKFKRILFGLWYIVLKPEEIVLRVTNTVYSLKYNVKNGKIYI